MSKKIIYALLFAALIASLSLSGCSFMQTTKGKVQAAGNMKIMPAPSASVDRYDEEPGIAKPAEAKKSVKMDRKVIYTAALSLQVGDVPKTIDLIKAEVKTFGGYLENSSIRKGESQSKNGTVVLRIPPEKLEAAMVGIKKLGDSLEESINGEDITKEYYDLAARLANQQRFEARLIKLLENSRAKLEDILQVETELARVREKIESMQGEMRYYNNLVGLSTLTISLYEKGVALPSRGNPLQGIIDTFLTAFGAFFASVGDIIVLVFAITPWLVVMGILIVIGVRYFKKTRQ
jgi:hypothetical protein